MLRYRPIAIALALLAATCSGSTPEGEPSPATSAPTSVDAAVSTTSERTPQLRQPSKDEPLRVGVIGDSVTFDAVLGIRAALESTGQATVANNTILGELGISVPHWGEHLDNVIAEAPEVLVVMLGGWDLGAIENDGADTYRAFADEAMDALSADGRLVIWLAMPPTPPGEGIEELRATLNTVLGDAAAERPDVRFVDTNTALGDPAGTFARFLTAPDGTLQQARKVRNGVDDGHLCPGGSGAAGRPGTRRTLCADQPRGPRGMALRTLVG